MKITITKGELFDKLKKVGKIIQTNKTNPDYDNFLFELDEFSSRVTGGAENGRLTTTLDCKAEGKRFSFTVNAKLLFDAIRELPEQPIVFQAEDNERYVKINICYQNGKIDLVGGKEYPKPKEMHANSIQVVTKAETLLNGLKKSYFCTSNDDLRPALCGVYIEFISAGINFVASDGHTLALIEVLQNNKREIAFLLPSKTSKVITDILDDENGEIVITVGKQWLCFTHQNYSVSVRLIEGNYPNYRSVIPKTDKYILINRMSFLSALKRVSVISNNSAPIVCVNLSDHKMILQVKDNNFSALADECIEIDHSFSGIKIGFNSKFLVEILSAIQTQDIKLSFSDSSKPALINPIDGSGHENVTYLIMPVQINE